jgi:hypothetical protein
MPPYLQLNSFVKILEQLPTSPSIGASQRLTPATTFIFLFSFTKKILALQRLLK